ncbi:MAG: AraC family transcriptional regulator [Eubacteriales bacterium]|nr:AraC family transcriptional regulator [Eubacteriales bacterium]
MQTDFIKIVTEDTVEIITDETLREMKAHGTAAFPFQYYSEHFDWHRLESIEWHWHTEMEFVEVWSGGIECHIGEQKIHLQEGDALFINSGVIHRYQPPENRKQLHCDFSDILFSPELIGNRHSAIYRKYVQPAITNGKPFLLLKQETRWEQEIIACYRRIVEICRSDLDMPELRIQKDISDLWLQLARYVGNQDPERTNSKNVLTQARLRIMMQFIWDHYTERISLEDIAGAANISKSAALRCFRAGMQMSPVGYLNDYRLNRAKDLLFSTHGTISEVAMSVGFDNVGYFDRVFKRAFGMTPRQFARQERQ